jgi:hypothetical protein
LPNKFKLGPFIIIIFMGKYICVKIGINSLNECFVLGKTAIIIRKNVFYF